MKHINSLDYMYLVVACPTPTWYRYIIILNYMILLNF